MLYSAKYNFIYIKSTKTASSSAEFALEYLVRGEKNSRKGGTNSILYPDGSRIGYRGTNFKDDPNYGSNSFSMNHMNAEAIEKLIGPEIFNKAIKISSIRNPYTRCISAFHFFNKEETIVAHEDAKTGGNSNFTKSKFQEYISSLSSKSLKRFDKHFFLRNTSIIDLFIKQEEFEEDLKIVLNKVKTPDQIAQQILKNIPTLKNRGLNKSSLTPLDYYTNSTIKLVNNAFANWFELGSYTMVDNIEQMIREVQSKKLYLK